MIRPGFITCAVDLLLISAFTGLLSACGGGGGGGTSSPAVEALSARTYSYRLPAELDDGWTRASFDEMGIDVVPITALFDGVYSGEYVGIDSLSIAYKGRLVIDERLRTDFDEFDDWIRNTDLDRHCLHSTSKSFVSALVGLAIDQGYIDDTEGALIDFFPYGPYDNWDDRKRDISLDHTLTMRLGLEWDEWSEPYGTPDNSLTILTSGPRNTTQSLLGLPLVRDPGSEFVYNTGASMALGELVERAVGIPMEDYAEAELFQPLQITEASWLIGQNGVPNTGSGLFLTTRSMLKFGQLYLDEGQWNGEQLLSREWVQRSVTPYVALNFDYSSGYGYQWWLGDFRVAARDYAFYATQGYGGQFIFVMPDLDLVVAFHARNYENGEYDLPFRLTIRHIIPAVT